MKYPESQKSDSRLMQNRQAAKRCRIKKKEEFTKISEDAARLAEENNELKKNVSKIYYFSKWINS